MNIKYLIEKIELLERRLGSKIRFQNLEPFAFNSSDIIQVQYAAKKIAKHLGLANIVFNVSYSTQKEDTAGHIDSKHKYSDEVFIEIDSKYKNSYEIVLAILSHEICHKLLYINNIELFPSRENEMLTDATTIFVGLGKLTLNGCELSTTTEEKHLWKSSGTTTTTYRVGYMSRAQFTFLYAFVCNVNRISKSEMNQGLNSDAKRGLKMILRSYSDLFDEKYFSKTMSRTLLTNYCDNSFETKQKELAKLSKQTAIIEKLISLYAKDLYCQYHKDLKSNLTAFQSEVEGQYDEKLRYIMNLSLEERLRASIVNKHENRILRNLSNVFDKFILFHHKIIPSLLKSDELIFLRQFQCPACKKKMRVGVTKIIKVKCPQCNYSFIVDTGMFEPEKPVAKNHTTQKQSFFKCSWLYLRRLFNK